jgi:hypothetical protein
MDLRLWVPEAIEVLRPLSVTTNLCHDSFCCCSYYNYLKYQITFSDLRKSDVSMKCMDSISVLWRPRGDRQGRSPLKSGPDNAEMIN